MSTHTIETVFAPQTPPPAAAAASTPVGAGPSHTQLPDVVSGGNPLAAAANGLLNLIPQIRTMATHPDPAAFQQYLLGRMRAFEQQAGAAGVGHETVIGARYCLCTVIDEACAQTPWGGAGVWPRHSLLVALHNETWGGEKFFQLLAKLVQTPQQHIDLIELMYYSLLLGFQGRYHVIENGASQLETLKARLLQVIETTRGERSGALSSRWQGVQRPATPPWTLVPLWGAAALALLLGFLLFLWFSYRLGTTSDAAYAAINGVRIARLAPVEAPAPAAPRLRQFLEPEVRDGLVDVRDEADRSTVVLRGDGLFDAGATTVKPRYADVLARVAVALDGVPGRVLVQGYTDNVPIRTARFPSNWQLSQARASVVAEMLQNSLRMPERVRAEGHGEADPIASNASAEGRARNRRVEILLLPAPAAHAAQPHAAPRN
ncbi:DotU family type VI secretion system protein [Pseudorhodoferax sp.]|uniref:DotU family type VI secretion system protein n=1 Tax=Pseudorhodoferax sp. TaxID=1993553 RepID=UPI002DD643B8|nr:DotU family type VI secretion system protein [Pseudorhodoferax sp.]